MLNKLLHQKTILCLMGPTASGKTDLAMRIADQLPVDIISVDSALIYQGMNIGTAKPTSEELANYPHQLIDICDPLESYSTAQFIEDASHLIQQSQNNHKIPLLVGGTMLYFRALLQGISELPKANEEIRAQLTKEAEQHGWQFMHDKLALVDPVSAKRIHPNDPQRIQRALEVFHVSGKSLTQNQLDNKPQKFPWPSVNIALAPQNRESLRARIAQRFHLMLEQGFEQEVTDLKNRGDLHLDLPSMRCVGYRQMWQYLDEDIDYPEMVFRGITATRQLAKRQMTWLRSWDDLHWLDTGEPLNYQYIKNILSG